MAKLFMFALMLFFSVSCSSFIPLKGKARDAYSKLSEYQIVLKKCNDCSQAMIFEAQRKINELVENYDDDSAKYTVEISITTRSTPTSLMGNRVSMRDKISVILDYNIIATSDNKIIMRDRIAQIDSKPLSRSTLSDFVSNETLLTQLLHDSLDDLQKRLVLSAL